MKRSSSFIAFCLLASQAQSLSTFCEVLDDLKITAGMENVEITLAFPDAKAKVTDCSIVRELGGVRSIYCFWEFAYRSEEAKASFDALVAQVAKCRGEPIQSDAPVNHPDSYQLFTFSRGASVGFKDKVSLEESHVILRVES